MKKVFVLLAIVSFVFACKPETDVEQTSQDYENITASDDFATDKDDVPSGGDKGDNGDE